MCGIAGIIRFDGNSFEDEITLMTRSIAHRGPDGEGIYIRKGVALGHRRLSIIDLETGKQPMLSNDEEVAVTFNGEIYNYPHLKKELARVSSDTDFLTKTSKTSFSSFILFSSCSYLIIGISFIMICSCEK